jgi:hypothetical protein
MKKISYYFASFAIGFSLFILLNLFVFSAPAAAQTSGSSCQQSGFISCVTTKFSTKFPFDIFANIPAGSAVSCPKIEFFFKEFDICFLYDAIKVLKFPAVAALLVRLYIYA